MAPAPGPAHFCHKVVLSREGAAVRSGDGGASGDSTLNLKGKGDLAEVMVAGDLLGRGHKIAIPYGEDCDFDLILIRDGRLERVQVKYARSDGAVICVRCASHSLTNGKIRRTKRYTAEMIDLLAVYDDTSSSVLLPSGKRAGRGPPASQLCASPGEERSAKADRGPRRTTSIPDEMEPAGFEPATFRMQTERSTN